MKRKNGSIPAPSSMPSMEVEMEVEMNPQEYAMKALLKGAMKKDLSMVFGALAVLFAKESADSMDEY